jgi:tryptophan-rich sensory protein
LTVIGALDLVVAAEMVALVPDDPPAAAMLAPYLGWTLFATALNATVQDPNTSL